MAKKTIIYDYEKDVRINSDGTENNDKLFISYQDYAEWDVQFRTVTPSPDADGTATLNPVDLSDATAWTAAMDADWSAATDPMCRTLNANIDSSDATNGNISLILDADTAPFLTALASAEGKTAWFNLRGLNADAKAIHTARVDVYARNVVDPSGGEPPEPVGEYSTTTEVTAMVNGRTSIEIDTALTLTDDATTNLDLGSAATYRAWEVKGTIDDGASYYSFTAMINHTGAVARISLTGHGDSFDTLVIDADYNAGAPQMTFAVTGHGSDLNLTYSITHKTKISA